MRTTIDRQELTGVERNSVDSKPPHTTSQPSTAHGAPRTMTTKSNKELIEKLSQSKMYRNYERAFTETTGMPIALCPLESWQLPHRSRRQESPFCAIMSRKSKSCANCLQVQQSLTDSAVNEALTLTCSAGLCDSAVPVRLGEEVIGFLKTGQVFQKKPSECGFSRAARQIADWGLEFDQKELRNAYFDSAVVPPKRYQSAVELLNIFASHLSIVSNQILVQQEQAEPPMIKRAKEYIQERYTEELSLGRVAKAVHASSFYFCKMFKKATGLNFTEYVSRVRIEKARNLLLNPNLRISEIAFEVGFQSLTHFNRVFKRIVGQSPTHYRSKLPRI